MKKLFMASVLTLLMINNPLSAATTTETNSSIPNYAVVNMGYIMSESKAVQSISKQVVAYKEKLEKLVQMKQDEIQQEQQNILSKQNEMSPKEFENAKKQFQAKLQADQQSLYEKEVKLQNVRDEALVTIEKSIGNIINEIAEANQYEIVFQAAALARYPNHRDISKTVLEKLNQSTPTINVKKPF